MAITSLTKVDIGQLVQELQQQLAPLPTWQDLVIDGTGQTLIEFIGTVGGYAILGNERAFQEGFYGTAQLITSVYEIMRTQGNRLSRKLPSSCSVNVTKPADGLAYTIPAYSQFSGGNINLYNKTAIIFNTSMVLQAVTLYEGIVNTIVVSGTGNDFQTFISIEKDFSIADSDIQVVTSGKTIPVVTDGLWHYAQQTINGVLTPNPVVQDSTTSKGELELRFGSANYGFSPASGQQIALSYIVTQGNAGNNASYSGTPITYDTYSSIIATSGLSGGANETDPRTYERIGPSIFSAFDRATTFNEYNATAVMYPGVIDARLDGQRNLAPNSPAWMNIVRACLITSSPWNSADQAAFITWYSQRSMANINMYLVFAIPYQFTIDLTVYCDPSADLATVESNVENALTQQMAPRYNWIKRTIYRSDIEDIVKGADPTIFVIQRRLPTFDTVTSGTLFNLIATEGTVGSGSSPVNTQVTYGLTMVSTAAAGESLPQSVGLVTVGGANVTISWDQVNGLAQINIYRLAGAVYSLVGSVAGSAVNFVDTFNTVLGAQQPPIVDAFPLLYPQLQSVNILAKYSSDRGIGTLG